MSKIVSTKLSLTLFRPNNDALRCLRSGLTFFIHKILSSRYGGVASRRGGVADWRGGVAGGRGCLAGRWGGVAGRRGGVARGGRGLQRHHARSEQGRGENPQKLEITKQFTVHSRVGRNMGFFAYKPG